MERCHVQRKAVTPEEASLCGGRQFVAVWRERRSLKIGKVIKTEEDYASDVTSAERTAYSAKEWIEPIRGLRGAVEKRAHHRRDVTLGEDALRTAKAVGRRGAHVLAARSSWCSACSMDKSIVATSSAPCHARCATWTTSKP